MKVTWKKDSSSKKRPLAAISKYPNLPFDQPDQNNERDDETASNSQALPSNDPFDSQSGNQLAQSFQAHGDKLAEDGKYREALGKWEAALNLLPNNAVLHEQKAQVLLEIGDAWNALRAATRATELEPSWAEGALKLFIAELVNANSLVKCEHAWHTLGRAQLNFGEPDSAIESFDRVLAIKQDCKEAKEDRHNALQLVKRRKQLHSLGRITTESRFVVSDKAETS